MSTSGNTISLLNRDDIIKSALRKLVVIAEDQLPTASQITAAAEALNIIVAEFRTLGMSVWAREEFLLTLVPGQGIYNFGIGQPVPIPYPMYIYDITLEIPPNFTKIQLNNFAIVDFNQLPKDSTGTPVNFNYQPMNNVGVLRLWPTPDTTVPAGSVLRIIHQRPLEVFDTAVDNPDFPQEWGNALIYNLALSLCDEYGVPDTKLARIAKQADTHLGTALSNSNEQGSVFFQPDWRGIESFTRN